LNKRLVPPPAIASRGSTITSSLSPSPTRLLDQLKINDIAVLTGASTVSRDDMGLTLEKVGKEVLGSAVKVVIGKDSALVVTDGSTQHAVEKQVALWKRSLE
ncbi:unnamed protein product, partial [Musa hybrid cultivar]